MCSSQVAGCAQICYVWTIYIINNHLLPKRRLIILCVHSKSVKSRVLSRRSKAQRTKRRMKNEEQTTRKPGVISSVNQIIIVPLLSPTFTVFNTNGAVSGRPAVELEASFLGKPVHPKTRLAIFDSSESPKVLVCFFGKPSLKIIEKHSFLWHSWQLLTEIQLFAQKFSPRIKRSNTFVLIIDYRYYL